MMLHELLTELTERRIQLSVEGEQLKVRAPKGSLDADLQKALKAQKAELVSWLTEAMTPKTTDYPTIVRDSQARYDSFPLTEMQQAYWIGHHGTMELSSPAYFYGEIEWTNLDVSKLSAAWQRLIERHDMLRAIILPTGEQQILEEVPLYEIKTLDLRG